MMNEFEKQAGVIEKNLLDLTAKLPHLPKEWRDMIVNIMPWIALIGGILMIVSALGWGKVGFFGAGIFHLGYLLVMLVSGVLMLMAWKPLQAHHKLGWNRMFWVELLMLLNAVISLVLPVYMFGNIIGVIVGLYLLFEVRDYYK